MKTNYHSILMVIIIIFSNLSFSDYLDYIFIDRDPTYNSFGQTGLIQTPTAETHGQNSIYFTSNKNEIWKLGSITATPFDWLEASYFYHRPDDVYWGSAIGLYLDKGFNVKLSYQPENTRLPSLAIGLDDFAGTGRLSREYIVSTFNFDYFKTTLGIGWGKYVPFGNGSSNPLSVLSDRFDTRPTTSADFGVGGKPSFDKWFRGDISYFGGFEIFIPRTKGAKLKVELDPFDYFDFACCGEGPSYLTAELRSKDSDINYGLSFPIRDFGNIDFSYIKGNTWNLSLSIGYKFNKQRTKKETYKPKLINSNYNQNQLGEFYLDILENLNRNRLYLQTADVQQENNNLVLSISSADIRDPIASSKAAAEIAIEVAKFNDFNFDYIDIMHLDLGVTTNSIKYKSEDIEAFNSKSLELIKRSTEISSPAPYSYNDHEFIPSIKFPLYFFSFNPDIRSHVGSPEQFLYSGYGFNFNTEILFSRNLVLTNVLGYSISDNFDEKSSIPNSVLPHVRTEIVDYLRGADKFITTLKLEYFWSPKKNIYAKFSAGYFETMFGGIGSEIIYKPFESNLSVGYEIYRVKRRSYEGDFKFLTEQATNKEYVVTTDHLNLSYYEPRLNILTKLSFGNYLAGDSGYTLDLSRKMPSGLQMGFFFTRTNISAAVFGEGSFDKGFYFKIPNDLFLKKKSRGSTNFALRSMTRDGGQKLINDNALIDSMRLRMSTKQEVIDWWKND